MSGHTLSSFLDEWAEGVERGSRGNVTRAQAFAHAAQVAVQKHAASEAAHSTHRIESEEHG